TTAVQHACGNSSETWLFVGLVGIIAAISLYEYFSSIKWQEVTSGNRNALVFANKNKNYGAYEIRSNYSRNLLWIILGLILFLGASYGGKMAYDKFSDSTISEEEQILKQVVLEAYDEPEIEEEIIEPEPEEYVEPVEDQNAFFPPVVTNEVVDTPPPTIKELGDSKVGTEKVEGNDPYGGAPPPPPKTDPVAPKEPVIETVVDEFAAYPGGKKALLKFLGENIQYPDIARELGLTGKSVLKFVVGVDGKISSVTVVRGMKDCKECDQEAIKAIRKMQPWTPAKKNGKVVPSYFILPVEFSMD
ncbi:MAG TPA: energy transducer TonB, partial [Crocinitomicaceae bacterium]|nr:energy transducer TonB [Crocinitomicaceae bacterium]